MLIAVACQEDGGPVALTGRAEGAEPSLEEGWDLWDSTDPGAAETGGCIPIGQQ
jgi:hypothetical protein